MVGVPAEHRVDVQPLPGAASAVLASGVRFLQPEEAVLDAMLTGWAAQQRSRLLSAQTIEQRALHVRRFVAFTNDYPWKWTPADVEEWSSDLVSRGLSHSTVRSYQNAVSVFLGTRPNAATAGMRSASGTSALIRCRCSTSGTRQCIAASPRDGRVTGR